jgi:cytochrome c oxidase subunit IV
MERDDIIEYSLDAHHSEEAGKKIRKKIWFVTLLLSVITAVEVIVGVVWAKHSLGAESGGWLAVKAVYMVLTIVKAGYIVLSFMHLGEERKNLKYTILVPYIVFILYLFWLLVYLEGGALHTIFENTTIK